MSARLQQEHTMLKSAVHAVTAQLRTARPRAAMPCTAAQWRTLCSLCALQSGDTRIAAAFVQHVHGAKMSAAASETLLQQLQAWWTRSCTAERAAWAGAPRTRAESLALTAARGFLKNLGFGR